MVKRVVFRTKAPAQYSFPQGPGRQPSIGGQDKHAIVHELLELSIAEEVACSLRSMPKCRGISVTRQLRRPESPR